MDSNLALARLAHLGEHLANVQGRPLFNLKVATEMEIRGIAATREGNVAVLCRKLTGVYLAWRLLSRLAT